MIEANKHTVTIIYEPNYEDIVGRIMYGDTECFGINHAKAIDDIEKEMFRFDWPPISYKESLSQEKAFIHTKYNNIVILNTGDDIDHPKLWIYLPKELSVDKKKLITDFINENRESIKYLLRSEDEKMVNIDIDSFLQNKIKSFTINIHNNNKNQ